MNKSKHVIDHQNISISADPIIASHSRPNMHHAIRVITIRPRDRSTPPHTQSLPIISSEPATVRSARLEQTNKVSIPKYDCTTSSPRIHSSISRHIGERRSATEATHPPTHSSRHYSHYFPPHPPSPTPHHTCPDWNNLPPPPQKPIQPLAPLPHPLRRQRKRHPRPPKLPLHALVVPPLANPDPRFSVHILEKRFLVDR